MIERPAGLLVDPSPPVPEPEASPRDRVAAQYAADLLMAFRGLHTVTGALAAHLENGGDPSVFMARAVEFDALVKAAGAAMMGVGTVMSCDGVA